MTNADELTLGAEFPPVTRDDWLAQVDSVLKGKPFSTLVSSTRDGIEIQPLYTPDDMPPVPAGFPGRAPHTRASSAQGTLAGWDVRQHHVVTDPSAANAAFLEELGRGGTSLFCRFDEPGHVAPALHDVHLDIAVVALDAGPVQDSVAAAFLAAAALSPAPPSELLGSLRLDPIGVLARHGALPEPLDEAISRAARTAAEVAGLYPKMRSLAVDATVWADGGATEADELAGALSVGVAYLRALTAAGLDLDSALDQLEFTWSATADQFLTIAKLRAARRLWSRVAEASGATPDRRGQFQHAVTSAVMLSRRDPWVNLLRSTVACFSAGVGGADAVTVIPHDGAIGLSDDQARRIARNTQLLLLEEAHLAQVVDPAGGAHTIEGLTDQLCTVAWARFQDLEQGGGMAAALVAGDAKRQLDERWETRLRDLARRKEPLTGVSEFPDINEATLNRTAVPVRPPVARPAITIEPIPLRRLAEPFEELRDAADAASGGRPLVFLANLGTPADHTTRSTWAKNLFEAGGIAAPGNDGFADPDSLAQAFVASGARLAAICSSDAIYAESAADAAAALRRAGAARIYLAGRPGALESTLCEAGVDEFVFAGGDVVDILRRAHTTLGLREAS